MARAVLATDPRDRTRAADEVTDLLRSYAPIQAASPATLLASLAATEEDDTALESELHALLELTSTGHIELVHLAPLRERDVTTTAPQLREYVTALLE
jgi:hypothetical protein